MMETPAVPPETDRTSTGLEQNTAALLSYIFTWVTGLIFYLLEKDNKYVRFHALQSILFGISWMVLSVVLVVVVRVLSIVPILGAFLSVIFWLVYVVAYVVILIMLMVKAFQGERYKLPIIGDIAERNV
jgi:uncharacterized membrane protein